MIESSCIVNDVCFVHRLHTVTACLGQLSLLSSMDGKRLSDDEIVMIVWTGLLAAYHHRDLCKPAVENCS